MVAGAPVALQLARMARKSVRDLWKAKLEGRTAQEREPEPVARRSFVGKVLGIDPSLRGTGLAVIEFAPGRTPLLLASRTIKVPVKHPMPHCLGEIHREVALILTQHPVDHVALEKTIYVQNITTAQVLGAARGAAISAAALAGRPVFEYAPLRVKQAVVGRGRASKEQVSRTVMALLGHGRSLALDESDAAGVALCHAFTWRG